MSARVRSREHRGYRTFLAHRISGVALAIFLPLHFIALGLALRGASALDGFLVVTERTPVKIAEWGLVVALSVHLVLGLRLFVLETHRWRGLREGWIAWGAGVAVAVGVAFVLAVRG